MAKKYRILLVLFLSISLALGYFAFFDKSSSVVAGQFSRADISLALYDLLDVGVVDINSDGNLDVYTTNHSARQSLLLGDGSGQFIDSLDTLKLGQDHMIPGIEDSEKAPDRVEPGYYIYRQSRKLHIVAHEVGSLASLNGLIKVSWPMVIEHKKNAHINLTVKNQGNMMRSSELEFSLEKNGNIQMNGAYDINELPHDFILDESVSLNKVYLGANRVNPSSHEFTMSWRDRHSMSWADINGDGKLDVYIGRGGVKGEINNIVEPIYDELFINKGSYFEDETAFYKMQKHGCPGRQSAWADYDGNGQLDLYVSCGRSGSDKFPNLFQARSDSGFEDVASLLELDFGAESGFVWVDSDNDSDMDLLVLSQDRLVHYRNTDSKFSAEIIDEQIPLKRFVKFSVSDFDNDGDFDVLLVSKISSKLLVNGGDRFTVLDPSELGLPKEIYSAEWVDIDNDGLVDIHVIPGGIFMQTEVGQFHTTEELDFTVDFAGVNGSRCSWFDSDNDGARDVLCAIQSYPNKLVRAYYKLVLDSNRFSYWKSYFFKNSGASNYWLQINLTGMASNRLAIGARVDITTESGQQSQFIGQNDGSVYSQGHYRLYFGLGKHDMVKLITVTWPDGSKNELSNIRSNQILGINY